MSDAVWFCWIGEIEREGLPAGSDQVMRAAVQRRYRVLTGNDPQFIFSGWGATLPERYRAVVEDREPVPTGTELIELERWRQVNTEGYTPARDAEHVDGELLRAAAAYVEEAHVRAATGQLDKSPIRNLVKAGALIAAEIDRRIAAGETY